MSEINRSREPVDINNLTRTQRRTLTRAIRPDVLQPDLQEVAAYKTELLVPEFRKNISHEEEEMLRESFSGASIRNFFLRVRASAECSDNDPFRKIRSKEPYQKRRVGGMVLYLSTEGEPLHTILSANRWQHLTPRFNELLDVSHHTADISIGGTRYVLHGDGTSQLEHSRWFDTEHVPRFLLGKTVTLSRRTSTTIAIQKQPPRDLITLQEQKPEVQSTLFGFDEERSKLQRSAAELFDAVGTQIIAWAEQDETLHETVADTENNSGIQLPTVAINGKPAALRLTTDEQGDDTISFTSPGYEPTSDQGWQLLQKLPTKKWLRLPKDMRVLAELEREVYRQPGFHMSRFTSKNNAVVFVNGNLEHSPASVIDDAHLKFEQALKEAQALFAEYFALLSAQPKPTLHARRQALAQSRAEQQAAEEARAKRSLGTRVLNWFGYRL